jgi:hypothetical protein
MLFHSEGENEVKLQNLCPDAKQFADLSRFSLVSSFFLQLASPFNSLASSQQFVYNGFAKGRDWEDYPDAWKAQTAQRLSHESPL